MSARAPIAAYLQLVAAMALAGSTVAVGKIVVEHLPVFLFATIRLAIATVILWPLAARESGTRLRDLSRSQWRDVSLLALFGVFLFTILTLFGVTYTSAAAAGVIIGAVPAAVALLAWLILRERLSPRVIAAVVIAGVGIAALNVNGAASTAGPRPLLGNAFVVAAVFAEGLFIVYLKRLSGLLRPIRMALAVNIVGLMLLVPFGAATFSTVDLAAVPPVIWGWVVYYALTASVLALILWYHAIAKVPAAHAGVFAGILPLSAIAVAVVGLGEPITLTLVVGAALVLFAIVLGTVQPNRD